jgi:hypothetical protein
LVFDVSKFLREELIDNRRRYLQSRTGDLTSFSAMLGDSFENKIDWLAQLIGSAHEPSLGQYKENLLRKVIREFIPKRYEVGSGFVLFPTQHLSKVGEVLSDGEIFSSLHDISTQLDIIIYDSYNFPVVFRDENFVIVRPESVRTIIEVKGSLDKGCIKETLSAFLQYAYKWKTYRGFYKSKYLVCPKMLIMAWDIAVTTKGYLKTDGKRLRDQIVDFYRENIPKDRLPGLPLLGSAFIYRDCIVQDLASVDNEGIKAGYYTQRGRLVRYTKEGKAVEAGDRTIPALLATIQVSLETPFNPNFSYIDQTNKLDVLPHKHQGFTCFLDKDESHLVAPIHFGD